MSGKEINSPYVAISSTYAYDVSYHAYYVST